MKSLRSKVIRVVELSKVYYTNTIQTFALDSVGFEIHEGEFVSVSGPSGCGKSTLLSILGMLNCPSSGKYFFNSVDLETIDAKERLLIRNTEIGFIFQNFNLIGELSVLENVELPLKYRGVGKKRRIELAMASLEKVGISHRKDHYPKELSGGQQQRVAVARAVVGSPRILLADEPTGNLDSKSGDEVISLLQELNEKGSTICMVTHDDRFARAAKKEIKLFDGKIV